MPDQTAEYRAGKSHWEQAAQFSRCHTSAVPQLQVTQQSSTIRKLPLIFLPPWNTQGAKTGISSQNRKVSSPCTHTSTLPVPQQASLSKCYVHPSRAVTRALQTAPSPTFTFNSSGLCNGFEGSLLHHRAHSPTSLVSTKHSSTTPVTGGRKPIQHSTAI